MLSTGGATPDSGEKCVSMAISHFHSPLPPSRRMTFVGARLSRPHSPHTKVILRLTYQTEGGFFQSSNPWSSQVGPGFCPELQPPYSWTRCLPTKKPGWSCTKNQQSRTSRPADFTQLPTCVQRAVPFT